MLLNRGTRHSGLDAGCSPSFESAAVTAAFFRSMSGFCAIVLCQLASWRRRMPEFVVGCIVILIVFGLIWAGFLFLMSLYFEGEGRSRDR